MYQRLRWFEQYIGRRLVFYIKSAVDPLARMFVRLVAPQIWRNEMSKNLQGSTESNVKHSVSKVRCLILYRRVHADFVTLISKAPPFERIHQMVGALE